MLKGETIFSGFLILLIATQTWQCFCAAGGSSPAEVLSSSNQQKNLLALNAASIKYEGSLLHQAQQIGAKPLYRQHKPAQQSQQYSINGRNGEAVKHYASVHQSPPVSQQHHQSSGYSSGHMELKSSYNLLSEAMSQAVSNEFRLSSSNSVDGACHADDLECSNIQDRLGMEAIRTLHRQLDDDDNGNIDLSESDDFLREELKYDSGYEKRQKAFHYNDDTHISVKELWEVWLRSEVHNWTIEQTTDWLAQSVQLPQYVDLFKIHKVSGATLPRLAVNNMHYVGNVLGIKDPIHKQKIALKAMDVVLFGPPRETGTRWKDYFLVTLLLSAIIGCWYAYQQNKNAKHHLRRMAKDMEGLQKAEQSLQEMQKELERARMEQENVTTQKMDLERQLREVPSLTSSSSDLEVQQLKKEIEILRNELSRAEIELVDNCWTPPPQLQSWLQYTYELESKNHLKKRVAAEKQLQSAREACEKLRKKRSSLVGAFVSTHGKTIDDVDRSIVEARNSLSDVTNELQERLHRWKQIEQCLGINIVNNNGLAYLENALYGRNGGGGGGSSGSGSLKGSRGRMTSSTDDLDDESVQGLLSENYTRNPLLNSGNIVRDDSSSSDDVNHDSSSVLFYLGTSPPTGITPIQSTQSITSSPTTSIISRNGTTIPISNSVSSTNTVTSIPTEITITSGNHESMVFAGYDEPYEDRINPYMSTDRSTIVPPRTKKQTSTSSIASTTSSIVSESVPCPARLSPSLLPSQQLSNLSAQISVGRTPIPPPRKIIQRPFIRKQSTELMNKFLFNLLNRRSQSPRLKTSFTSTTTTISYPNRNFMTSDNIKCKRMMIKQHSIASQQSTSSTSSSIQSAPDLIKIQTPTRISALEKNTGNLPSHLWTHVYQQSLPTSYNRPNKLDFIRHRMKSPNITTNNDIVKEKRSLADSCFTPSDTQLNASNDHLNDNLNVTLSFDALSNEKRRRRFRFSFGGKKSNKNQNKGKT